MTSKKKLSVEARAGLLLRIKELAIIGMFSDDALMETLVLKGGNALDLIYGISLRASVDVDFSMQGDFPGGPDAFRAKVEASLTRTYGEAGLHAFDFKVADKPDDLSEDLKAFWGGYDIDFKLIETERVAELGQDLETLRRQAINLGLGPKFLIDVSRHEFVEGRESHDLQGYRVFVYSPAMILAEKLRALCQQMTEYGPIVKRSREAASRARDFVDIHQLAKAGVDMTTPEHRTLLQNVFDAKHVPLEFLQLLPNYRSFHAASFPAVKETLKGGADLADFDVYFDFVLDLIAKLQPLGDV